MTLRNGLQGDQPIFGSAYISSAAATSLATQNVYVDMAGTFTEKVVRGGVSFSAGVFTVPKTASPRSPTNRPRR